MAPIQNAADVEAAFEAVPPELIAEIMDGELFTFPGPARPHTRSASRRTITLGGAFDVGDGAGVIVAEPEPHLGPRADNLVPDLAWWMCARTPDAFGDDNSPAHPDVAPDWLCEIFSPRTERTDRRKKVRVYRTEGLGHAWLLSPLIQTLEVYRPEGGRWLLVDTAEGAAPVRAEPFEAVELDRSMIWAR